MIFNPRQYFNCTQAYASVGLRAKRKFAWRTPAFVLKLALTTHIRPYLDDKKINSNTNSKTNSKMKGQNKGTQFYAWAESKISFKKGVKVYICPVILTLHFGIGFGIGIGIEFSFVV